MTDELPRLVHRNSIVITRLLPAASNDAVGILLKALEEGLNELRFLDPSETHNVSAQFWIDSREFFFTDKDGSIVPATTLLGPEEFYPSYLIDSSNVDQVQRQVRLGHLTVVAYESLVPYLQSGGEASVDALAKKLLDEAARVVNLGIPTNYTTHRFLDAFCAMS
ncbi:hypothetical protein Q0M94_02400 [Deinococcus radiomollis]|uniref:hypothetical protein n=1 Tax=Deinococcus radiomollis TaxID=468916 RepID=UPI003892A334